VGQKVLSIDGCQDRGTGALIAVSRKSGSVPG